MNELALFAGIGGGILGGQIVGWRTVCAVERDAYCSAILAQRQNDGFLPVFPIWSDVTTFDGKPWRGIVDIISGGFPCQDISVAGKGQGIDGEKSGLWKQFARIIGEVRPQYAFIENSPALVIRGLDVVLSDLAALGYDAQWLCLSAAQCGAPHKRDRIWILAHANGQRIRQKQISKPRCSDSPIIINDGEKKYVANANGDGCQGADILLKRTFSSTWRGEFSNRWPTEPAICRVVNGLPNRLDRIKALGNAQVPRVAAMAFIELMRRINECQN